MLLAQAVATSIDAFAVGVSFCAGGADIFFAAPLIALTTFLCSLLALAPDGGSAGCWATGPSCWAARC